MEIPFSPSTMRAPGTEIKSPGLTLPAEPSGQPRFTLIPILCDGQRRKLKRAGCTDMGEFNPSRRLHSQPFYTVPWDAGRLVMASPLPERAVLPWIPMSLGVGENSSLLSSPQVGRYRFLETPGTHTEGEGLYCPLVLGGPAQHPSSCQGYPRLQPASDFLPRVSVTPFTSRVLERCSPSDHSA